MFYRIRKKFHFSYINLLIGSLTSLMFDVIVINLVVCFCRS